MAAVHDGLPQVMVLPLVNHSVTDLEGMSSAWTLDKFIEIKTNTLNKQILVSSNYFILIYYENSDKPTC